MVGASGECKSTYSQCSECRKRTLRLNPGPSRERFMEEECLKDYKNSPCVGVKTQREGSSEQREEKPKEKE